MTHDKLPSDTIPSNDPNFQLTKGNHPIVSLSAALKIVALLIIASGALFLACAWRPMVELGYITHFLCLASFLTLCLGSIAAAN